MSNLKPMNLQLFADPIPPEGGGTPPITPPEGGAPPVTPDPPKTFTQAELDVIIGDRLARATKGQPTKDELKLFKAYQDTQKTEAEKQIETQKAIDGKITAANERLIKAEIKGLEGYDTKLLSRLVDKSLITVDDNGDVSGITEQLAALETEFPMIKKAASGTGSGANPPGGGNTAATGRDALIEKYNEAEKRHDTVSMMALMTQIKNTKK